MDRNHGHGRTALAKEQESIDFYTGMRAYVPARLGTARIDRLIDEERNHAAILHQELTALNR